MAKFTTSHLFLRGDTFEECGRILAFIPKALHKTNGRSSDSLGRRRLPVFTVA